MVSYWFVLGVLGLILLTSSWTMIRYKFKAAALGVRISWTQIIGQRLRNTLTDDILEATSLSIKERLGVDIIQLETHKIAGGKPLKVVKEMVDYKRKGKSLEFNSAAAFDLAGQELGDLE